MTNFVLLIVACIFLGVVLYGAIAERLILKGLTSQVAILLGVGIVLGAAFLSMHLLENKSFVMQKIPFAMTTLGISILLAVARGKFTDRKID